MYERRGVGAPNVLGPRQLASIHRIEAQLSSWVASTGVCARDASCECVPLASALSYLYPTQNCPPRPVAPSAGGGR